MEDHLDVRVPPAQRWGGYPAEGWSPARWTPYAQLLPLLSLEGPQVALQLPVQIALALQIGMEQLSRRSELEGVWERSSRVTPRLASSLARYWLR